MANGTGPSAALLWIFSPAPGEVRVIQDPRKRELEDAMRRISDELGRIGLNGSVAPAEPSQAHPDLDLLSRRERDVVTQLLQGHRVVSIAELLDVSEHTVRNHLKSIFRKLGVHSQAELVDRLHSASVAS
jgi:DNA-binding NarL/FixJ family response regulator